MRWLKRLVWYSAVHIVESGFVTPIPAGPTRRGTVEGYLDFDIFYDRADSQGRVPVLDTTCLKCAKKCVSPSTFLVECVVNPLY